MPLKRKVAVLMGGSSAERAVSLSTGKQILNALDPAKYEVFALDTSSGHRMLPEADVKGEIAVMRASDGVTEITSLPLLPHASAQSAPDVVFIALHGPGGEDGSVQGMLEVLGIPYTGSGVLASALAMDKAMCKRVLTAEGVRMPQSVTFVQGDEIPEERLVSMPPPWIVKPNAQGSTIGMTRVESRDHLDAALALAFQYGSVVLIEQFITGTEISVPVLGNRELQALPIVEIVPAGGFYDYEAKYTAGATDEIVPARLSPAITEEARDIAQRCHQILGCLGMSRTDMIVTAQDEIFTLEVNTIPGMTPTSLLPRSAQAAGIAFPQLLDILIDLALEK